MKILAIQEEYMLPPPTPCQIILLPTRMSCFLIGKGRSLENKRCRRESDVQMEEATKEVAYSSRHITEQWVVQFVIKGCIVNTFTKVCTCRNTDVRL